MSLCYLLLFIDFSSISRLWIRTWLPINHFIFRHFDQQWISSIYLYKLSRNAANKSQTHFHSRILQNENFLHFLAFITLLVLHIADFNERLVQYISIYLLLEVCRQPCHEQWQFSLYRRNFKHNWTVLSNEYEYYSYMLQCNCYSHTYSIQCKISNSPANRFCLFVWYICFMLLLSIWMKL